MTGGNTDVIDDENATPGKGEDEAAKRRYALYAVAFFVGAATMGAELGAARLVAPFFGDSTMIWALVIGAALASLSVGQLLGGWLSERGVNTGGVGVLLVLSAAILVVLPVAGRPMMSESLQLFYGEQYGRLVASGVLVTFLTGLPLVAMGAVGPLLLQLAITDPDRAGIIGSYLYAWGTLGSLLGTYVSGLVLIPLMGTTRTFWGFAALLVATAVVVALPRRRGRAASVAVVAFVAAGVAPDGPIKEQPGQIYEEETPHNYISIIEEGDERRMLFNEGFAIQSIYHPDHLHLEGLWGYYAVAPAWTTTGRADRALMLGLGGGTAARQYSELYPDTEFVGVELDSRVVEAGRQFMGMPDDVEVATEGARGFLTFDDREYDVILLDAFQFPYVPFQLTTVEFFELVDRRLADGGALLLNVGRDGDHRDVVHAVVHTVDQVFEHVRAVDVPATYNTIVYAGHHALEDAVGVEALGLTLHQRRPLLDLPPPHPWEVPNDTPVLTDDRAPISWLTDLIVLRVVLDGWW